MLAGLSQAGVERDSSCALPLLPLPTVPGGSSDHVVASSGSSWPFSDGSDRLTAGVDAEPFEADDRRRRLLLLEDDVDADADVDDREPSDLRMR